MVGILVQEAQFGGELLDEDDLVGHVFKSDEWKVLRFPAIAEEDERHEIRSLNKTRIVTRERGEALHPDREPLETLNGLREVLGEYQFAGQYQQAPAPIEGGMIKRHWFQRYAPHQLPQKFEMKFQSWDTANKAAEINDFSVCTTWAMADKHLYLLDLSRVESPTHIMAMGLDGSLDDAFRDATANMAQWLTEEYKLTPSEVAQVMGTSAEYKVSEVADRNAGIVIKINKERLQPLALADSPSSSPPR